MELHLVTEDDENQIIAMFLSETGAKEFVDRFDKQSDQFEESRKKFKIHSVTLNTSEIPVTRKPVESKIVEQPAEPVER